MKNRFLIRLAGKSDIPFLADVERSAAAAFHALPDYDPSGRVVEPLLLEQMSIEKKLWVATASDGKLIGFIGCEDIDDFLYIHEISVAHDFQKQGIGRSLMLTALDEARERGYKAIGLTTRRDAYWNGPFYRSLGFCELTDEKEWPGLFSQLQREIVEGADPLIRCAMIKIVNR